MMEGWFLFFIFEGFKGSYICAYTCIVFTIWPFK